MPGSRAASSGIGSATARVLSAAGAEVVLSARRADKIEALAREIRSRGGVALVRPLDVTDKAASERIGRELAGAGGIHVLVNNAGVIPLSPVLEDRVEEWEQTIDVNIRVCCTRYGPSSPTWPVGGTGTSST